MNHNLQTLGSYFEFGQVFPSESLSGFLCEAGLKVSKSLTFPTPPSIMGMVEASVC